MSSIGRALDLLERLVIAAERSADALERGAAAEAGQGATPAPLDTERPTVRPKLTPEGARNVEAALRRRRGAA